MFLLSSLATCLFLAVVVFFQGDSGGPFLCRDRRGVFTQRGVAAFATGSSATTPCTFFSTYTNVSAYYDWIYDIMRNN